MKVGLKLDFTVVIIATMIRNEIKEFSILRSACSDLGIKQEKWSSRQHYLRFDLNHTHFCKHSRCDESVDYDCTLGFPDQPSFRSGTCHPHLVFDFEQRKPFKDNLITLIVMDVSLFNPDTLVLIWNLRKS